MFQLMSDKYKIKYTYDMVELVLELNFRHTSCVVTLKQYEVVFKLELKRLMILFGLSVAVPRLCCQRRLQWLCLR
jgi:hypothetical protein